MEVLLNGAELSKGRESRRGPTVETILYLVILLAAIVTRFALLDSQAMHHDEGIHALYGWNIYTGRGWVHDGVYHGPWIYHIEALSFLLFGDSDATSRVMQAIFSIATVMLPVLLRRQLGRWGALLASFLFLISPTFLYFGRFGHPDVFGAFFTLAMFVCVARYLAERKSGWLYGAVLAECLHFCAKPTAYIVTAAFLLYLGGRLLWERYGLRAFWLLLGIIPAALEDLWKLAYGSFPLEQVPLGPISLSWLSLIPLILAVAVTLGMLALEWWECRGHRKDNPTLDLTVALGTMVLPLLSAFLLNLLLRLRNIAPLDYHTPDVAPDVLVLAVVAIGVTFLAAAAIGVIWDVRRWAIAAGIFWGVFFTLYTSFFSSMTGWATGLVQTLGFWLTQQGVKRIYVGPQYYLMLMSVYETVAFLFGTIGAAYFAWRGLVRVSERSRSNLAEQSTPPPPPLVAGTGASMGLLTFWAPAVFALYSLAGEQIPWLNLHPTLPFILLTGALFGRIIAYRPRKPVLETYRRWANGLLLVVAAVLLVWAGRSVFEAAPKSGFGESAIWLVSAVILLALAYLSFSGGERAGELPFVLLGLAVAVMTVINGDVLSFGQKYRDWWSTIYIPLALVAAALIGRAILLGKTALRSTALLLFALLCTYGFASACRLTYVNNDTPIEMLIYVQSSSDLQWTVDELAALSTFTTGGKDMRFTYDNEVAWPLEWYVRNYPQKAPAGDTINRPPPEDTGMALVYREKDVTSSTYLEGRFAPTRFYSFNWWFPEDTYKSAQAFVQWMAPEILTERKELTPPGLKEVVQAFFRPSGQARVWRYLLFREPPAPLGAREFAVYVRRDLVPALELFKYSIRER